MAYQLSRPPYKDGMQDLTMRPRKTMAGEMWDKTQRGRQQARVGGVEERSAIYAKSLAEQPPAAAVPQSPLTRVPPGGPQPMAPRPATSSAGGTITQGGLTRVYPGSQPGNPAMNSGGTITRGEQTVVVPPSPYNRPLQAPPANPVVSPTTVGAPQTESSNPLTGTSNQQPQGSTGTIRTAPAPAQAMGFSSRGSAVPAGQDALANGGGNAPAAGAEPTAAKPGLMSRQFARPESQAFYDRMVKRLYGQP